MPSRFLEEIPAELMEELGTARRREQGCAGGGRPRHTSTEPGSTHYAYEDEDQSVSWASAAETAAGQAASYSGKTYNSIENIADFFASRGKKFSLPKVPVEEPRGKKGFRPGRRYGILNMAKARSTSAKEKVKRPRLRYNSLASV